VLEVDLLSLQGEERAAALDAIVRGEPSPYVLCDGRLVSSGALDARAVLDVLGLSSV
jgi:hypothetical protein